MALNLEKAKRYNRASARTVGWIEKSTQVFAELGFANLSPSEIAFATAVAGWQRMHGLEADGLLGPSTWKKLEPRLKASPSPSAASYPKVDWFKLSPKPATRGTLLVHEGDVKGGANLVNDAYDLALYQMSDGSYDLELFMKVQFFFESGPGGAWSDGERKNFMRDWKTAIIGAWSTRNLHVTKSGKSVSLSLRFETQDGGFMWDHWEIEVTKVKKSQTATVTRGEKEGGLDSRAMIWRLKSRDYGQKPAVHEFGHMLGNPDEYKRRSRYREDSPSIMHHGDEVRPRHLDGPRSWVVEKLRLYGIE